MAGLVLVVEDNKRKMDDFMSSLARSGYDILGVTNTSDARYFMGKLSPDAVVVGHERADGSGYEFGRQLRSGGFNRAMVLISEDFLDRVAHPDVDSLFDTHLFYPIRDNTLGLCIGLVIAKYESLKAPPMEPSPAQL